MEFYRGLLGARGANQEKTRPAGNDQFGATEIKRMGPAGHRRKAGHWEAVGGEQRSHLRKAVRKSKRRWSKSIWWVGNLVIRVH